MLSCRHSDTREAIARLEAAVTDVPCEDVLGVVVYDLPGRDCAAKASNGELKVGEIDVYKTEFIDRKYPRVKLSSGPEGTGRGSKGGTSHMLTAH